MMRKLLLFAVFAFVQPWTFAQTQGLQPEVVRSNVISGITSSLFVIDNRSSLYQMTANTFCATGTGTWSVSIQYSDGSPSGPWYQFPDLSSQVTNLSGTCTGIGSGYHDFISFNITGSASVSYAGTKYIWVGGVSSVLSTGALLRANNLSDLYNPPLARSNLGITQVYIAGLWSSGGCSTGTNSLLVNGYCGGTGELNTQTYTFSQAPGGSISVGSNTITLAPVPLGVNGSDSNHYLCLECGKAGGEAVLITGGTASSGATSGTITFTAANSHSGAWTVSSATAGCQEAVNVAGVTGAIVFPAGQMEFYAPCNITQHVSLRGQGEYVTLLHNNSATTGVLSYVSPYSTGNSFAGGWWKGFTIYSGSSVSNTATNSTVANAIYIQDPNSGFIMEDVSIQNHTTGVKQVNGWDTTYQNIFVRGYQDYGFYIEMNGNVGSGAGAGARLEGVNVSNSGSTGTVTATGCGIRFANWSGIYVHNSTTTSAANGFCLQPRQQTGVETYTNDYYGYVSDSAFDTSVYDGILIDSSVNGVGGANAAVSEVYFENIITAFAGCLPSQNCSTSPFANAANGVHFLGTNTKNISFIGGSSRENGGHGIKIEGTPVNLTFVGLNVDANSQAGDNTYDGYNIANGIFDVTIKDSTIGKVNTTFSRSPRYGIYIGTGGNNFLIMGNSFFANETGTMSYNGGTTSILADNYPYDDANLNQFRFPRMAYATMSGLTPSDGTRVVYCYDCNTSCSAGGSAGRTCSREAGTWVAFGGSGGGSSAFGAITSGTNTTAAMAVGSGASLTPSGTGAITSNSVAGSGSLPGTCSVGQSYQLTSATATAQWYLCTATNTWTLQGGGTAAAGAVVSVAYASTVTLTCGSATAGTLTTFVIGQLTGNITINGPTTCTQGQDIGVFLLQDATGGRTVTWGSSFGSTTPGMVTYANSYDYFRFTWDGTYWQPVNKTVISGFGNCTTQAGPGSSPSSGTVAGPWCDSTLLGPRWLNSSGVYFQGEKELISGSVRVAGGAASPDTALTLTTTGSSGAATLSGGTLNIPQYSGGSTPTAGGSTWVWGPASGGTPMAIGGSGANSGFWAPAVMPVPTVKAMEINVTTAAGSSKGIAIGVFAVSSGLPTGSPLCSLQASTTVQSTGRKSIAANGGTAYSGGVCSIPVGTAVAVAFTSDDTSLAIDTGNTAYTATMFANANTTYNHSCDDSTSISTGSGGSITFTSPSGWTNYQGMASNIGWPAVRWAN